MLEIDAVVFNIGFMTNLGPIEDWGLEIEKNAIKVDSRDAYQYRRRSTPRGISSHTMEN